VLPNGDPVTINTIHPAGTNIGGQSYAAQNDEYYINNPIGSPTFQFDGGTVVLTATYAVTPCQTYHIKLCVADAFDQEFDGAVFLAAKSFNSENVVLTNYGNSIEGQNNIFEGCSDYFRIERSNPDVSKALELDLVLAGTATNGVDIQTTGNQPFPNHVTIPAFSTFVDIPYHSVVDAVADNGEIFTIKIATSCPCATNVVYVEKSISIFEHLEIDSVSIKNALCYNQNSGSFTVNASSGTGSFDYSKNNGVTWQRSNIFNGLAPGTYTIKVRDPGSCYSSETATATIGNPAAIIADAGSPVTICSGQSTQLNGSGGVLYSWSPSTGLSSANIPNPVATPAITTTYTLTTTNALGQCPAMATLKVTVNPSPVAAISQLNLEICKGGNTTLTASGGNSYVWNPGGATTASIIVSPIINTNYTVTATSANGCSDSEIVNVAVNETPSLFNVTGGGSFCAGGSGVTVGLSGSQNGVNYQLKLNGANIGSVKAGNGTALSFGDQTLAGTYTIDATTIVTSCFNSMTGNAVVVVNTVPVAPTIGTISQPTCSVSTGSAVLNSLPAGNWILNPGAIAGSGTSYTLSGLTAGKYAYTVTNAAGCTSLPSANIVINTQPVTPLAPALISVIQPTCLVSTGSKVLGGLPAGNWVLNPGAIAGTGTSFTLSGLVAGTYAYTVTNAAGCTSLPSASFTITAQPPTPSAPAVGTIIQPTCTVATGSIELNNLPSGAWTINPGAISGSGSSKTITGLSAGTYSFTVTNASGCTSLTSASAVLTAATPASPIIGTVTQLTCSVSAGSIVLSGLPAGNWIINPGAIAGTGASKTITGLTSGTYSYTVTNASGCESQPSTNSVINAQPVTPSVPSIGTITHPTCTLSTGSVVLNDLPAGNWTINPGAITGTGTSKTISGISTGNYTFTVTNASGCTSVASASVFINAQPPIPLAPIVGTTTQPTCSLASGSVQLTGLPAGSWTLNPGAIAGNTTTTTISGLSAGTYTYTVTLGCTSAPSANIVINAQPATPSAPTVGTITHPTCSVATGSVILTGLPAGNWTINPGAIAGTGTSKTITGLTTGTYNYNVTNASGCISSASANIVINLQPVTPSAPIAGTITQPTCTVATGSVVLNGLPSGNWILNPGAIAGTGASTTITGLSAGTIIYTVTNNLGCTSLASANVVINAQPATPSAPTVGTITQPTCTIATGSAVLSGLPSGNWILNPGAIAGTGSSRTITGLASGTYNYTVTNSAGCISSPSANIVINLNPVTPTAPIISSIIQPDCGIATGRVNLSGLPAGNWTINPGAITGTGNTTTIGNLLAGTYNYTVTNSIGCTSSPSNNIVIVADPGTPAAPTIGTVTQPSCSVATGSILLTGLPAGSWTINPGAISGSGNSTTISGLATGTYTFTVSNGVGCISLPSMSIIIGAQPITPSAPIVGTITQPTCAISTGSVVLTGLPAGIWTINPGAVTATGASRTITGINAGTYAYTVTNSVGCTSLASTNVVIIAAIPSAPIVGTITQPTCSLSTGSVELSGLPTGSWIINPGAIAGTGTNRTISGLAAGTRNFTVTNSMGCTSLASANVVISAQPVTPAVPIVGTITQPTCTVSTGIVVLSGLPSGNWTINPGAINGTGSSTTISGLISGTYNFNVTNAVGCISSATASVLINAQPVTPSAPVISSITQPSCEIATGSIELSSLPAGNWTLNPGTISGAGSNKTISGLTSGIYAYTVTNSLGCTSIASANVVIISNPGTPSAPSIGAVTQPTCTVAAGTVQLNNLPAGNWIINPGNISGTGTSTTISGVVAGTYNFTVTNGAGCISLPSVEIVINSQPITPPAPTLSTITQPTCSVGTGSVLLTGLPSGNWTINPGAIASTGVNRTISGLAAGTYSFTVTNALGCKSAATSNVIINAQPVTPSAPIISTITQPTCSVSTGSVILNGLPSGNWVVNPGAIAGTGTSITISGLSAGTRTFTVTNSVGCASPASASVVINVQPSTPSAPTVGTILQPTCTTATGSVVLNGLPSGNWTLNPGSIAGVGSTTTVTGLSAGTYNYSITNSAGCTSAASANIVINTQPLTPSAPITGIITQPTCSVVTGSVELSGLPLGNWIINPGAIAGTGVSKTVTGITPGTKTFTVTNASGCISPASASVVINSQPVTPSAPAISSITQTTCSISTGSVILGGLPTGNWTINPGSITGNSASATISGLFSGTYNYSVTNSSGCTSVLAANIVINTQPLTPSVPAIGTITQPDCFSATGSVLLSSLPTGNWILNPGAIAGTGSSKLVSGLVAGIYAFTVTNASGCTSGISDNFVINPQPEIPTALTIGTITQPTCSNATGSITLSGLPVGAWTINPGAITGTGSNTTISGLTAGIYTYTVTNSVGCSSTPSANAIINTQPVTPAAPTIGIIIQLSCTVSTGSAVLNGLPAGNWTINPGVITGSGSSKTITGLVAGTYTFSVTNASGCTSVASANLVIHEQPVTPSAPTIGAVAQPNCSAASGSIVLNGLPSGNWILNPGTITGTGESTILSGLNAGTYNYSVTNSAGCISVLSANVVINAQPVTPSAPMIGNITQPECTIASGSVELNGLPAGNWTINPGAIAGTGLSTIISDLVTGTYSYTVTNDVGCTSAVSTNIVINTQPSVPSAPIVGAITQPNCEVATGSVVLNGLPPRNWTINPGGITGNTSSVTISNLVPGTYNFTVTKVGGCSSLPSVNVVIIPQPLTPPAPTVSQIIQPTCSGLSGSIFISAPIGAGITYSIDGSTYTNTTGIFTMVPAGNYNVTAKTPDGCKSLATNVNINTAPAELIFAPQQVTNVSCSGGIDGIIKASVSGGTGLITYSIIPNIGIQSPVGTFNNLTAQSYTIAATDVNGCTKSASVAVGTVTDVTLPSITSPANISAIVNTGCTATGILLGTPVTSDNCGVASVTNNAPVAFPIGINSVTWTVTDNSGNKTTSVQTVTVTDNVPPTITCPANITATTNTACSATGVVLGSPVTADNCGVASVTNNAPVAFPLGATTVTWTVTDNSGNTATCTQTVTVSDNRPPTIICPASVSVNANIGFPYATGVNLGTPVTSDNCGVASVTNNAPAQFPVGSTMVTWTVTDVNGLSATCTQTVIVSDTQSPVMNCPATIMVSCIDLVPAAYSSLAEYISAGGTVTDNDGINSATFALSSQTSNGLTCPEVITRLYTVADINNNFGTCSQLIIIDDKIAPAFVNFPVDITVQCSNVPANASIGNDITASDNCDASVIITFENEVRTNGSCAGTYTLTRTWKATDKCGNFATKYQTINVQDITNPVLSGQGPNATINCPEIPAFTTPTATDACDASPVVTFLDVTVAGACAGTYTTTRTWTAKDDCGNISLPVSQTIIVQDLTAPVISTQASDLTVVCDGKGNLTALNGWLNSNAGAISSDICSNLVLWSNNFTGINNLCGATGMAKVTFSASDNCGNFATTSATFTILDTLSPVLSNIPNDTTVECISLNNILISNEFVENGDFANATLPFYFTTNYIYTSDSVGNSEMGPEGLFAIGSDANKYHWDFFGSGRSGAGDNFLIVNGYPGAPQPIIWSDTITGLKLGSLYYFSAWARSLNDAGFYANLKFSINDSQIGVPTGPLPAGPADNNGQMTWMKFYGVWTANSTTAVLSIIDLTTDADGNDFGLDDISFGTAVIANDNCDENPNIVQTETRTDVSCPNSYTLIKTWTATDACGNSSTASQTINVQDMTAPVIAALPAESTIDCPTAPKFEVATASDVCGGDFTLTFSDDTTHGVCAGSYSITRTWTAKDACGNSSTASQTINVQDMTAPVIAALPAESTIDCPATPVFAVATASDNCGSDFTLTFNDVTTPGACAGSYSITRTWIAKDACGNSSTASQTITVQDMTAPVIAALPTESTIDCPATPVFAVATASDNCGSDFTLTFTDVTTPGACAGSYSKTRTWTAKDACGNSSTASQTINVRDMTAPVIAALPAESTIDCPATPEFAVATASDNCGSDITLTFSDVTTPGACAGSYSITRTWTAKDACGNSSTAAQTINVHDMTAPVIAALPAESTIDCPATPVFAVATASDNCGSDFTLTFNDVTTPGACAGSYSITRTWTAKDACGNSSTASQTIKIHDITAPVVTCPANIAVSNNPGSCGATVVVPKPTIIENCGTVSITNSFNQTADASGYYPVGTSTIEWTVTDACGNTSSCSMTVTVTDTEAPVIICPTNLLICATTQVVLGTATATDNCGTVIISNNAPLTFETGTTMVVWTATDLHGNVATCSQNVTISPMVKADAGTDIPALCTAVPYKFTGASASNYSSLSWTHNGHGSLSDASSLNPVYTPSAGETGAIEFKLTAYGTSGCGNTEVYDKVILTIYPSIVVDCGGGQTIAAGTSTTLQGSVSGGSGIFSYTWEPGAYLVDNTSINPKTLALNTETTFTLTALDAISGCSGNDNVTISIYETIRPIARDDYDTTNLNESSIVNVTANDTDVIGLGLVVSIVSDPKHGIVELNADGFIIYTPDLNFAGNDTITYMICDKGTPSKCSTARVIITIFPIRPASDIEIYNLVTPDGDGKNDFWYIGGIENFPDNDVQIFNRWGTKIKEYAGYNNTNKRWDGTNDKNKYLPEGVYFYIIKIKDLKSYTGWVYIRGTGNN
jgi:gliding motility-associated-like protein